MAGQEDGAPLLVQRGTLKGWWPALLTWLPWALLGCLWWIWILEPFRGLGMATQDQLDFSLLATRDLWRGVVGYATGQARVHFLLNKLVELWIAARPEQALREAVNLASFALAPCFVAYTAFTGLAHRLAYVWLFWSLAWLGFHHLPPAAYPTINHWPFLLWALAAAWASHRARRPGSSLTLSAAVFGALAYLALFQYEAVTVLSLGMLGWVVYTRARGPLQRALWISLAAALLLYAASYLGWRALYPARYDGATIGSVSLPAALRVTVALALGALPFSEAFTYGTPLRWGDRVIGEANIGFASNPALQPGLLGSLLTLGALLGLALAYSRAQRTGSSAPPWRALWLLVGLLVVGVNAPLGLTEKYQGWIQDYSDAYITSQLTQYPLALGGVALLDACWRRLRLRGMPLAFGAALLAIALLSLPIQAHNRSLAPRQRGNFARWEAAVLLARAGAYTAEGQLVAPDLFYGVFAAEHDWSRYWGTYVRQRFGRAMTFHALPVAQRPDLPLARLHRFEDGALRALSIQHPDVLHVLARPHQGPAQVFWGIGQGVALDWDQAQPLGNTGYLALSLTTPWSLLGTDKVLELVWSTPGTGVLPEPRRYVLTASAQYSSLYPAFRAADGVEATEWLLPDATLGWVELEFEQPRQLREVYLRNSVNLPHRDRGTHTFHLEAFDRQGRLVASGSGAFPGIDAEEPSVQLPLLAEAVSRLRVHVDGFHGLGGGLAEIAVR